MSLLASFIQDWFQSIKVWIHELRNDKILYIVLISILSISILLFLRFIFKNIINVNSVKKNVTFPILMTILFSALLIMLCTI